jgi:tetratricopeptide (TPR) repeat protein
MLIALGIAAAAFMPLPAAALTAQAAAAPEATSLLGKPLVAPPRTGEAGKALLDSLARAEAAYRENPNDADAIIWLGRRTAYLGRYREAIRIFSEGIDRHPQDARMYRHRGHRYITVRELDRATADLEKAAALVRGRADEVEPDGQPNTRNVPTSTLQSNVFYHLALARYLQGDFARALEAWRQCLAVSKNPDMLVATSHWLYMTLRRLQREEEARAVLAPIAEGLDVIENGSYYELLRMYKRGNGADALLAAAAQDGLDAVTIGYGVANWHFYNGRRERAQELFRKIVAGHAREWPAFGYLAAEAELARAR